MQMASSLGLPFLPATFGQYAPSVFGHYNLALTIIIQWVQPDCMIK